MDGSAKRSPASCFGLHARPRGVGPTRAWSRSDRGWSFDHRDRQGPAGRRGERDRPRHRPPRDPRHEKGGRGPLCAASGQLGHGRSRGRRRSGGSAFPRCKTEFDDASVDMLFVDGDHSHEGVRLDIDDWTSSLRAPAIVGFHDFQLSGVRRAPLGTGPRASFPLQASPLERRRLVLRLRPFPPEASHRRDPPVPGRGVPWHHRAVAPRIRPAPEEPAARPPRDPEDGQVVPAQRPASDPRRLPAQGEVAGETAEHASSQGVETRTRRPNWGLSPPAGATYHRRGRGGRG
jgi:hypothetical protein